MLEIFIFRAVMESKADVSTKNRSRFINFGFETTAKERFHDTNLIYFAANYPIAAKMQTCLMF